MKQVPFWLWVLWFVCFVVVFSACIVFWFGPVKTVEVEFEPLLEADVLYSEVEIRLKDDNVEVVSDGRIYFSGSVPELLGRVLCVSPLTVEECGTYHCVVIEMDSGVRVVHTPRCERDSVKGSIPVCFVKGFCDMDHALMDEKEN